MDDHLAWKTIFVATIFSLLILAIAYFFISPKDSTYFSQERSDKIAEFRDTKISGRKEGKKTWEFMAQEGYTSPNRELTYLKNVSNGTIYIDEQPVVKKLAAPLLQAYSQTEVVEALGQPKVEEKSKALQLTAYLNLGRLADPATATDNDWLRMSADNLKYFPKEKRSEIKGNVTLIKNQSRIFAQTILVDHTAKIAEISDQVNFQRNELFLTAKSMRYWGREEKIEAINKVVIKIKHQKIVTKIKADLASFFTDTTKDASFSGNVEVVQGKKFAVAKTALYSERTDQLLLSGDVRAVFAKAASLIKEDSAAKLRSSLGRKLAQEKTSLTAQELMISCQSGDAKAKGSVLVSQNGREAKADEASYNDRTEEILLTGNTFLKKNNEWISAAKIIVSVKAETLRAIGSVEAEFKL